MKKRESAGTHADEIETSMMLYIAPESVQMKKAARDINPDQPGGLTRDARGKGIYSPTGAWGDPTLATREKGEAVVESLLSSARLDSLPSPVLARLVASQNCGAGSFWLGRLSF